MTACPTLWPRSNPLKASLGKATPAITREAAASSAMSARFVAFVWEEIREHCRCRARGGRVFRRIGRTLRNSNDGRDRGIKVAGMLAVVSILRVPCGDGSVGDRGGNQRQSPRLERRRQTRTDHVPFGEPHPTVAGCPCVPITD